MKIVLKVKSLYIIIFLLILGVLISQIKVIPSWENIQTVLIISILILALVLSLLFIFNPDASGWMRKKKKQKISRMQQVIRTVIMVTVFPLVWIITIPSFNKPELVNEVTLANKTIYVYHDSCFPPDGACECDSYGSLIYIKNQYIPMMYLVLKTDFYVESVQLNNGELIAKASDICSKDIRKIKKTNL